MASTAASVFPDDVLREIFLRLPTRSICRLRAVCKPWLTLTWDPAFLRAHARRAPSSPVALTWSITERDNDGGTDLHLSASSVDDGNAAASASDLRVALPGRCRSAKETRSWDGVLCVELDTCIGPYDDSYVLLNPVSRACTIVTAPDPCRDASRVVSRSRGYIAGAYSHPVTGTFHLLYCYLYQVGDHKDIPWFQLLRVDGGATTSTWREIPASTDIATVMLQSIIGHSRCASTATVGGILHWRPTRREQRELLVYDTEKEEFGSMPLPQLGQDTAVVQRSISTLAGKLCLLAEVARSGTIEVWVLEDYQSQDWRLRQRIQIPLTPLFWMYQMAVLRSVEPVPGVDGQVEKVIFHGKSEEVYNVRSASWMLNRCNKWTTLHRESLLPHDVIFGAAPRAQGVAFSRR